MLLINCIDYFIKLFLAMATPLENIININEFSKE